MKRLEAVRRGWPDIEAERTEEARRKAIEAGHEVLTMEAAGGLYGIDASAVRHAALRRPDDAVRFTLAVGERDLKLISKSWGDDYWCARVDAGYEDRLRALREVGGTCWIASAGGMWLLLGVGAKETS